MEPPKKKNKLRDKIIRNSLCRFFSPKNLIGAFNKKIVKKKTFYFNGNKLEYIYSNHNDDYRLKERSIEIPIVCYYLEKSRAIDILEIGNVSNYYYEYFSDLILPQNKIVIDRFEKRFGTINEDIKYFKSKNKFSFIFSISTFEHMDSCGGRKPYGYDSIYITLGNNFPSYPIPFLNENINSHAEDNIIRVVNDLLNPKGTFIITAPVGYTPEWDEIIFKQNILNKEFLKVSSINIYYMKKISQIEWKQVGIDEAKKGKIHTPFDGTNILSIVEIIKRV